MSEWSVCVSFIVLIYLMCDRVGGDEPQGAADDPRARACPAGLCTAHSETSERYT